MPAPCQIPANRSFRNTVDQPSHVHTPHFKIVPNRGAKADPSSSTPAELGIREAWVALLSTSGVARQN